MLMVPKAPAVEQPRSSTVGGGGQVRVPDAEVEQGAGPSPPQSSEHQKGFLKEHCDLDPVPRCSR